MKYLVCLLLALAAAPVAAQESNAASPKTCWVGSLQFSPGATVRASDKVMLCSPDLTWVATDTKASGCIHAQSFYSAGALRLVSEKLKLKTTCQSDGTWK